MQCCTQGRAKLKNSPTQSPTQVSPGTGHAAFPANPGRPANPAINPGAAHRPNSGSGGTTTLSYNQSAPILVHGPITGRQYLFSSSRPEQTVDRRDVEGLLSTGLFRRVA